MGLLLSYQVTGVEGLKTKEVNDIVRDSMHSLGLRWRDKFLKDHFTSAGGKKYGYTPRKGDPGSGRRFKRSYVDTKIKRQGHSNPLVFFGDGRDEALRDRRARATATSKKALVVIPLPKKFNFRHPNSDVNMADEIRAVTSGEIQQLERWLVEQIEDRMTKAGQRRAGVTLSLTDV